MRIKKVFKMIKKSRSRIENFLSLISSAITVLSGVFSVIAYLFPDFILLVKLNIVAQKEIFINVFTISLLISTVLFLRIAIYYYKDGKDRLELFTYEYRIAAEQYRDLIYTLQLKKEEYTLDVMQIATLVNICCLNMLDSLCELIMQITKSEVFGCIKLVDPLNEDYDTFDCGDQTVTDFVRTSNTPEDRINKDPFHSVKINRNTDFYELMNVNNGRSQFYQPDLLEYAKLLKNDDHEYLNSTAEWKDKYKSTAVVPIRLENRKLTNEYDQTYSVLGFLCFDAPEAYVFHAKHKDSITSLMKAYASLLYCVFDKYDQYLSDVQSDSYLYKHIEKVYNLNGEEISSKGEFYYTDTSG